MLRVNKKDIDSFAQIQPFFKSTTHPILFRPNIP